MEAIPGSGSNITTSWARQNCKLLVQLGRKPECKCDGKNLARMESEAVGGPGEFRFIPVGSWEHLQGFKQESGELRHAFQKAVWCHAEGRREKGQDWKRSLLL